MSLEDNEIKGLITKNWDESSVDYDTFDGHGIKSEEERAAWVKAFMAVLPEGRLRILDVGCGTGEMGLVLAGMGHEVTGLDLSEKMLEKARSKASALGLDTTYRQGDAEKPPFAEGTFDALVTRHVLWTLPHPEEALREWCKILKDGGMALVIEGVWDDGSPGRKIRRAIGDIGILLAERRNPRKGWYGRELNAALPNSGGVPAEKCAAYLRKAGFKKADIMKIAEIRDIQRKHMPLRYRIMYTDEYYLTYGVK